MLFYLMDDDFRSKLLNEELTINELKAYVLKIIDYLDLKDYVNDIVDTDLTDMACYNTKDKIIKVNVKGINKVSKYNYLFNELSANKNLYINLSLLVSIFHEITHIIQYYLVDNDSEDRVNLPTLYYREFSSINEMSSSNYAKYYYCIILEREADITAYENIIHMIYHYFNQEQELFTSFLKELRHVLTIEYVVDNGKVYSPLNTLYSGYYHEATPRIEGLDTYDALKLGTNVSLDDYNNFLSHSDEIINNKFLNKKINSHMN